jgi:hypothetical protein
VECVDGGDEAGSAVVDQRGADLRERRGEVGQVVFDRDLLEEKTRNGILCALSGTAEWCKRVRSGRSWSGPKGGDDFQW